MDATGVLSFEFGIVPPVQPELVILKVDEPPGRGIVGEHAIASDLHSPISVHALHTAFHHVASETASLFLVSQVRMPQFDAMPCI